MKQFTKKIKSCKECEHWSGFHRIELLAGSMVKPAEGYCTNHELEPRVKDVTKIPTWCELPDTKEATASARASINAFLAKAEALGLEIAPEDEGDPTFVNVPRSARSHEVDGYIIVADEFNRDIHNTGDKPEK